MAYATLSELKDFLGITDTSQDTLLNFLLDKASKLIDDFCNRTFGAPVDEEREILVKENSPKLFIDDLISITTLKLEDSLISPSDYKLYPLEALSKNEPFTWLQLNEDILQSAIPYFPKASFVKINGKWGYQETVPDSINFATILWVARLFRERNQPEGRLNSESIGDYSVNYARTKESSSERPEDILLPFKRIDLFIL